MTSRLRFNILSRNASVALLWLAACLPASAQRIFESAPIVFTTPEGGAYSVAAADFTGDLFPDLLISSGSSVDLLLIPNNGVGMWSKPISLAGNKASDILSIGDYDDDGDMDAISFLDPSDTTFILKNDGLGNFSSSLLPITITTVPVEAKFVKVAVDMNGDVYPDPILSIGGELCILPALGNGSIGEPLPLGESNDFDVDDLDGDEIKDIALVSEDGFSILWNDGSGGFASASDIETSPTTYTITTGDFDGDGDIDVFPAGPRETAIGVYWNQGKRNFEVGAPFINPEGTYGVGSGDYNGDGIDDVSQLSSGGSSLKYQLSSLDAPLSNSYSVIGTDEFPPFLCTVDTNLDGTFEAICPTGSQNSVHFVASLGGMLPPTLPVVRAEEFLFSRTSAVEDLDGDGLDELISIGYDSGDPINIYTPESNGAMMLANSIPMETDTWVGSMCLADLDADGLKEVLCVEGETVVARENTTALELGSAVAIAEGAGNDFIAVCDIDNDGSEDDLLSTQGSDSGRITSFLHTETGEFAEAVSTDFSKVRFFASRILDLNGDTLLDMTAASGDTILLFAGDGKGGFDSLIVASIEDIRSLLLVDVDRDSDHDILILRHYPQSHGLILINDGFGQFAQSDIQVESPRFYGYPALTCDIDGDGIADLVQGGESSIAVSLGDGKGGFGSTSEYSGDHDPSHLLTCNANNDGAIDLLMGGTGYEMFIKPWFTTYISGVPTICSLENTQPNSVEVVFSGEVADSALVETNYSLGNGSRSDGTHPRHVIRIAPDRVRLVLDDPNYEGMELTVVVSANVKDSAGNPLGFVRSLTQTVTFGSMESTSGWIATD